jgi:hypothetical protein
MGASSGYNLKGYVFRSPEKRAPEPPNTRLSVGDYIADILLDARPEGTIYHWIVQRVGSAAIIHWGQEYTFEDAHATVKNYLEKLLLKDKPKKA